MKSSLMRISDMVILDGEEYKINTDFRVWIEIEGLLLKGHYQPQVRLAKILTLAYPILPPNPFDAVQGIMWFYSGGADKAVQGEAESGYKVPCYDLSKDFDYIWGAFMSQYGIDLTQSSMHWWRFKALLACLDDNCKFMKIVGFRSVDTSKIKNREQKRFYEKMKKQFRLKSADSERLGEEIAAEALAELF